MSRKKKPEPDKLSRRERQIMDILFELGSATAREVMENMAEPPSYATVRTLLRVLLRKRQIRHHREGKAYVYQPVVRREAAANSALKRILKTYYDGSIEKVISGLMGLDKELSPEELSRIDQLIKNNKPSKGPNDDEPANF